MIGVRRSGLLERLSARLGYMERASLSMLRDPSAGLGRVQGRLDRRADRKAWRALGLSREELYRPDPDWSPRLHDVLGVPWGCEALPDFQTLWSDLVSSFAARGLRVGRATYGGWNDADADLAQAVWCLVAHLRPRRVVETGVAQGITSRFILEGLERNGAGRLWSIDLPHLDARLHDRIGAAVPEERRSRWTYVEGSSRRRLQPLLADLGEIDLFVHDSLHTGRNVRFELEAAWPALSPGGALVVDDISHSLGFHSFAEAAAPGARVTARHADGGGLWGILIKGAHGASAPPARGRRGSVGSL